MRRLCFLLSAVAVLLAAQSQDQRKTGAFRLKCVDALKSLTTEKIVSLGLNADFSAEMLRLIRTFEVADHDPALFVRQMADFQKRMDLVACVYIIIIIEMSLCCRVGPVAPYLTADERVVFC